MEKIQFLGMDRKELEDFMAGIGEARFRGRQVYRWIYIKGVSSFHEMSDIPKDLRYRLEEMAVVGMPRVVKSRVSKDKTRKFLLEMGDRKKIEMVVIPQTWSNDVRYTLCLSTQVGCPLGCAFCATGASGFERNLTAGEMVGQLLVAEREIRRRDKRMKEERVIGNIVFMGMGEPLLNLDEVVKAIRLINDEHGINIGQRHITVSTVGYIPGIEALMQEDLNINLAVSLHATTDEVRNVLVPINKHYPLTPLLEVVARYAHSTKRQVTLEYVLIWGVNDTDQDARRLADMAKSIRAHVNLIRLNEVEGVPYRRPEEEKVQRFFQLVQKEGASVTLREEMGSDIEAACGQLKRYASAKKFKQENGRY